MSVPMCNRFHARRANSGKMTTFYGGGVPLFDDLVRGESPHPAARRFVTKKTRVLAVADSEDFMILSCVVLTQYTSVTDRQADGRTDGRLCRTKDALALPAAARNKTTGDGRRRLCSQFITERNVALRTCTEVLSYRTQLR